MRELRAITEAVRGVFDAPRLRRDPHAGARVRAGAHARGPGGRRPRVQAVRRAGQRARAALGHDDPDRARRRDALRGRGAAAALLLPRRTPTAPSGPSAARRARCCRRGSSSSACPRTTGTAEALTVLCAALDARADRLPHRARRRRRCTRRCSTRTASPASRARADPPRARDARLRRAWSARSSACGWARRRPRRCCGVPQRRGGARGARGRRRRPADGLRAVYDAAARPSVAERVIFDLGLARGAGLLHGRGLRGLRRRARRAARRRRPLRRPAGPLRPRRCPPSAGRSTSSGCTSRSSASGAGSSCRERARTASRSPCRAARCCARRSTCSTRSASTPPRCAPTTASCCSRSGPGHHAPVRRRRPTSRRAPPTSGSPARTCSRAVRARRLRAARPRLGPCVMVFATDGGRGPARRRRCAASA